MLWAIPPFILICTRVFSNIYEEKGLINYVMEFLLIILRMPVDVKLLKNAHVRLRDKGKSTGIRKLVF